MTIDVNILSISIICVVIRFVYVASFRVTRHQYVTGKNATAKSIKKLGKVRISRSFLPKLTR